MARGAGQERSRNLDSLPRGLRLVILTLVLRLQEGKRPVGGLGEHRILMLQMMLVRLPGAGVGLLTLTQMAAKHRGGHRPQRHLGGVIQVERPIRTPMEAQPTGGVRVPRRLRTSLLRLAVGARALRGKEAQLGMWYVLSSN